MAEFSKLVITNKGQALLAKTIVGEETIKFIKASASDTEYTLEQIEALTEIHNVKQTVSVSMITRTNDTTIAIEIVFDNTALTEGYHMRTLGLYAIDPDEGEILYAVTTETSGCCYMPANNGVTVSGACIKLVTTVGNAENVLLEVDPGVYATVGEIKELRDTIVDKYLIKTGDSANNTVRFTQAGTRVNLVSGENHSSLFGKIAKWFADLKTVAFSGSYNDLCDIPDVLTKTGDSKDNTVTFNAAANRETIMSGEKHSMLFGKIAKWFADLKTVAFSGSYNDLSNKPSIPSAVKVKGNAESAYRTGNVNLTPANIGALPLTGGTLTGDLRIKGDDNYGTKINLGDGDYVHFYEPDDDFLEIKATNGINFLIDDGSSFSLNGTQIFNGYINSAFNRNFIGARNYSTGGTGDTNYACVRFNRVMIVSVEKEIPRYNSIGALLQIPFPYPFLNNRYTVISAYNASTSGDSPPRIESKYTGYVELYPHAQWGENEKTVTIIAIGMIDDF